MRVEGGVVSEVERHPLHESRLAVAGTWSGGLWAPGSILFVQQWRDRLPLGVWEVKGVEVISKRRADPLLLLEPRERHTEILPDDVLVFGSGIYSEFEVRETDVPTERSIAVELGDARYAAILRPRSGGGDLKVFVFHKNEDSIKRQATQPILWRDRLYSARIDIPEIEVESDYPMELYLNTEPAAVDRVIRTLKPVRDFILDAGQEMLFRTQRGPGGRRLGTTYEYFDPIVTAGASDRLDVLRLVVHPARPDQLPLFVQPEEPLRLLVNVLAAAATGDTERVSDRLLQHVFSVDELLKRVLQLAETTVRFGELRVRAPDAEDGIRVSPESAFVIKQSIRRLETRSIQREGILYGLDLYRGWCRVLTDVEEGHEDWTLRFSEEQREELRGSVPRRVFVAFETKTKDGMRRGTGFLQTIKRLRELSSGTIKDASGPLRA